MSQTLQNGIVVPINADAYNLTADLATMGGATNPVIIVANAAARDALTPKVGMMVSRSDAGGWLQVCTAVSPTAWQGVSPYASACGYVTVPSVAAAGTQTATITFPTGRFSQPPIMSLVCESYHLYAGISTPTTTSASLVAYNPTSTATGVTVRVHWTATQMTDTSAAG